MTFITADKLLWYILSQLLVRCNLLTNVSFCALGIKNVLACIWFYYCSQTSCKLYNEQAVLCTLLSQWLS